MFVRLLEVESIWWLSQCTNAVSQSQFPELNNVPLSVILQHSDTKSAIATLITEAAGNLINEDLTQQLQLDLQTLELPKHVQDLYGLPMMYRLGPLHITLL